MNNRILLAIVLSACMIAVCRKVVVTGGEGIVLDLARNIPVSGVSVQVVLALGDNSQAELAAIKPEVEVTTNSDGRFVIPRETNLALFSPFPHGDPIIRHRQWIRVKHNSLEVRCAAPGQEGWMTVFLFPSSGEPFSVDVNRTDMDRTEPSCPTLARKIVQATMWGELRHAPVDADDLRGVFKIIGNAIRESHGLAEIRCAIYDDQLKIADAAILYAVVPGECELAFSVAGASGQVAHGVRLDNEELGRCKAARRITF